MIKLQNCTPEFVHSCCPNQSGSVIFHSGILLLLTENSVLSTSAVSIRLRSPEGEFKNWYEDGQLWEHYHYINGELEGEFKNWYEDGQLCEHCHYVNSLLEGEFKSWRGNGRLWRHEIWENGRRVKIL